MANTVLLDSGFLFLQMQKQRRYMNYWKIRVLSL